MNGIMKALYEIQIFAKFNLKPTTVSRQDFFHGVGS